MRFSTPFEFDIALHEPVFSMMRRGIRIDTEKKNEFARQYHTDWDKWQGLLNEVAGRPINVNSPKQMKNYLYGELGVTPRRAKKKVTTNEDALRAIMADAERKTRERVTSSAKARWMRIFLSAKLSIMVRGVRKSISSYTGCPPDCECEKPSQILYDDDGRMRCEITIGGAETMRFSHSKTLWGTGVNMATIPHKIRPMFVANEGYELAEVDLNRGESWVYAFLSMDPELIRIHTSFGDFHAETASAIQTAFGVEGLGADEIARRAKQGDYAMYKLRYLGKKVNHSSSYRMGPYRGAEVVNQESDDTNITVTPGEMNDAQKLWRRKYFGIESWWDSIDYELEHERTLTTPFGRSRQFFGFMSDHLKKEATAYIPQSTSVDYMNFGMLRVYRELVKEKAFRLELLHQNHDSILVQYPIQHRDEVIPEIMERCKMEVNINGTPVTIPTEATYGQNWGDYHPENNPDGLREWEAAT